MAHEEKKNSTKTAAQRPAVEETADHAQDMSMAAKSETARQSAEIVDSAMDIVKMAQSDATSLTDEKENPKLGGVADSFKGLPMRDLIANPLIAAAEAQQKLAAIAWDFYQKIAFKEKEGKPTEEARTLDISFERPVEQNGEIKVLTQKVSAPFIGLVPIPSLLIDQVNVDFQMEVTENNVNKESTQAEVGTKISAKWFTVSAEISGKVSTSRENTRTTNQTAKYQVRVNASQQPQTEGLSKLMDIMAKCVEPVAVGEQK